MRMMPKHSESIQPQNTSYSISRCQQRIQKTKTTKNWIQVLEVLQATRDYDKSRILHSLLDKREHIVVKLGDSNLKNEFSYGKKFKGIKGFIKFDCFFECDDNYLEHPSKNRNYLCKNIGTSMQVIVMPYYQLGSIKVFEWNKENKHVLHSCMKQACLSVLCAFSMKKLIHGDFHAGNVLLNATTTKKIVYKLRDVEDIEVVTHGYQTIVMDFENTTEYNDDTMYDKITGLNNFYYDLKKFFTLIVFFVPTLDKKTIYQVEKVINTCVDGSDHPLKLLERNFLERIDEIDFI